MWTARGRATARESPWLKPGIKSSKCNLDLKGDKSGSRLPQLLLRPARIPRRSGLGRARAGHTPSWGPGAGGLRSHPSSACGQQQHPLPVDLGRWQPSSRCRADQHGGHTASPLGPPQLLWKLNFLATGMAAHEGEWRLAQGSGAWARRAGITPTRTPQNPPGIRGEPPGSQTSLPPTPCPTPALRAGHSRAAPPAPPREMEPQEGSEQRRGLI